MTSDDWKDWAARSAGRQAAAVVVLWLAAVGIRALVDPWIGDRHEFLSAYGAVAVATWLATWRAGVAAAVLTIGSMAWLFDGPRNDAELLHTWHGALALTTAIAVSALIIFFAHRSASSRRALVQRVERLDEADHRKSDFLALVAHELRNPLSTLKVGTGLIKRGALDASTLPRTLDMVERQTNVMQRLVNDLLDVARVEQGKIELSKETTAISDLIECAATDVRSLTTERGPRIVYVPQNPGDALIDRLRIGQVIGNLLHNAVKFSPPDSQVTVTAGSSAGEVFISVKDEGVGIAADELDSIFKSFVQLDAASSHPPGLGLGLSLSRKLVEMHAGVLEARSDGPGRGAEFIVRLPRGLPEEVAQPPQPGRAQGAEDEETASKGPLKLLVVDDNRDAADSLALLLTLKGYSASTAGDGRSAIEAAAAERPDMVFLDIGLPDMSGHEVAVKLRQRMSGDKQPVLVALTGWGSKEDRQLSRQAGFDIHLTKPVSLAQLDTALASRRTVQPRSIEAAKLTQHAGT